MVKAIYENNNCTVELKGEPDKVLGEIIFLMKELSHGFAESMGMKRGDGDVYAMAHTLLDEIGED